MSWGIVAGAAIGAAGSYAASSTAAEGQEGAAQTTAEAGRYSADIQKEMYEQGRADLTPYSTLGTTASPLLQYLTTGIMPTMTQSDMDLISRSQGVPEEPLSYADWTRETPLPDPTTADLDPSDYGFNTADASDMTAWKEFSKTIDPTTLVTSDRYDEYQRYLEGPEVTQPGDVEDIDQFSLANALARQQSINALQGGYQMQESPMYSWQQEQGERALNRQAAAKGLSGSRASLNALSDFNRGLGAQESDKQYGRLLDMTNIGRGMAATGLGAGQSYAAGAGSALMGGAQQSALYSGMAAQTKGSMYENLGQGFGQMATNYLGGGSSYTNPYVSQGNPLGLTPGQGL